MEDTHLLGCRSSSDCEILPRKSVEKHDPWPLELRIINLAQAVSEPVEPPHGRREGLVSDVEAVGDLDQGNPQASAMTGPADATSGVDNALAKVGMTITRTLTSEQPLSSTETSGSGSS